MEGEKRRNKYHSEFKITQISGQQAPQLISGQSLASLILGHDKIVPLCPEKDSSMVHYTQRLETGFQLWTRLLHLSDLGLIF